MRHRARPAPARVRRQDGSVMLEALVSVVVTSLAMLASAALAINAAKVNQTGRYRAQAVMLVNDIAERLTANSAAAALGAYTLSANYSSQRSGTVPNCSSATCTSQELAQADLAAWSGKVLAELPQSNVQLVFTAAAGTTPASYAVTVNWTERSVGHGGTTRTNAGTVNASETFTYTATAVLRPR